MQKGRILLSFFIFSLFSFLLLILVFESYGHVELKNNVPNLNSGSIQSFEPSIIITSIPVNPTLNQSPTPSFTITKSIISAKINKKTPQSSAKTTSQTEYILEKVNEYRASLGLSKVVNNSETCKFASIRAQEISSAEKFNHDGFTERVNTNNLPYPTYSQVTENIAYNTDYTDVVSKWIASPGHEQNLRKDTPFVCIGKYGDYYAYEGWKP